MTSEGLLAANKVAPGTLPQKWRRAAELYITEIKGLKDHVEILSAENKVILGDCFALLVHMACED